MDWVRFDAIGDLAHRLGQGVRQAAYLSSDGEGRDRELAVTSQCRA